MNKITPEYARSNNTSERCSSDKTIGQRQSLFNAGVWQTSGTLIQGFLSWLLILILAREDIGLGANGVGLLSVGSVIFATSIILLFGIKKYTSQRISQNCMNEIEALKEASNGSFAIFIVSIIIGVVLLGISFLIASPLNFQSDLSFILFMGGILTLIIWYREGAQAVLAGKGEYYNITKSNLGFWLCQFVTGILLIFIIRAKNLPISLIFISYAFGLLAQILLLHHYFKPHHLYNPKIFQFYLKHAEFSKNIQQGFSFAITEIVPLNILNSITLFLLFLFSGDFAISGAYSIALGYAIGGLLITNFTWPLITHIAEAYGKGDSQKIQYHLTLVVKIFFYVTFLILVFYIGLSQGFILIFYGKTYMTGITDIGIPFILVILASSITGFEYTLCSVLLGVGKTKPATIYLGLLFLTTIGFSSIFLWLKPFNPQINVSLGYLIGTLVILPLLPSLLKREINQKVPFSIGLRTLFALICTLFICFILVWPPFEILPISNLLVFLFMFPVLSLIYLIFLVFFGSVSQNDLELIEKKLENYRLKRYFSLLLSILRKIMSVSPFYKG